MNKWFVRLASVVTLLATVAGFLLVLAAWLGVSVGRLPAEGENTITFSSVLATLMALLMTVVGVLILRSRPQNAVGWSVLAIGFGLGLNAVTLTYALVGVSGIASDLPALEWVAWVSQFCWTLIYFGLMLLLLVFPTGQFLSPRWRWVAYFGGAVIAVGTLLSAAMNPYEIGGIQVANPVGGFPQEQVLPFVNIVFVLLLFVLGAGLVSLVLRYARAQVVERQQIKWLIYAMAVLLAALVVSVTVHFQAQSDVGGLLVNFAALGLPLALGIAILRYRLFDIDIIIRKTLTCALVVTLLAFVYFGSVILLQQVFAIVTGERSEVITVLSTLAIAALFVPLRNRVQIAIDRRFYRKKYDAQKVLQGFGETVRDETDLENLTARLLEVVQETMQPRSVGVWLKQDDRPQTTNRRRQTTAKTRKASGN